MSDQPIRNLTRDEQLRMANDFRLDRIERNMDRVARASNSLRIGSDDANYRHQRAVLRTHAGAGEDASVLRLDVSTMERLVSMAKNDIAAYVAWQQKACRQHLKHDAGCSLANWISGKQRAIVADLRGFQADYNCVN